jgi:hypothetical protein
VSSLVIVWREVGNAFGPELARVRGEADGHGARERNVAEDSEISWSEACTER